MRAIAALAAILLVAQPCAARTAIVVNRTVTNVTSNASGSSNQRVYAQNASNISKGLVASFLNRYNPGSFDYYTGDQVRVSLVKNGTILGRSYSQIIWIGFGGQGMAQSTVTHTVCRECSLTFIASGGSIPTVPMLFLGPLVGETGAPQSTGAACSTGVNTTGMDPGTQGPDTFDWRYHIPGNNNGWPAWAGQQPGCAMSDTPPYTMPSGTFRVLLGADGTNMSSNGQLVRQPKPAWRDSIMQWGALSSWSGANQTYSAASPTLGVSVWVRYNDNPIGLSAGAKPAVFCAFGNMNPGTVGGGASARAALDQRIQPDPTPLYIAMAFLDSLSGGDLLGTSYEPAKLAVQISGGFRRGLNTAAGGIAPYDTVSFKAAMDSLKTLGLPITVGVNADSMNAYASDLAMWKRGGINRWALESWDGVADSSKGSGNASVGLYRPAIVDPFGRFRSRKFMGATADTTDTSMVNLLARGRKMIAEFTGDYVDGVLIAAQDDASPANKSSRAFDDSLAAAIAAAGFSGISQNADDSLATGGVGPTTSNPWGYGSTQRSIRGVMFLSHPGFNPRGATYGHGIPQVTDGSGSDSSWCISYTKRTLFGLFNNYWESPQNYVQLKNKDGGFALEQWASEPGIHAEISPKSNQTGVNLVRVTASGFGSGELTSSPNMPAFYTLKYLRNQVDAINSFGRTLIVFTSPDGIGTRDILR